MLVGRDLPPQLQELNAGVVLPPPVRIAAAAAPAPAPARAPAPPAAPRRGLLSRWFGHGNGAAAAAAAAPARRPPAEPPARIVLELQPRQSRQPHEAFGERGNNGARARERQEDVPDLPSLFALGSPSASLTRLQNEVIDSITALILNAHELESAEKELVRLQVRAFYPLSSSLLFKTKKKGKKTTKTKKQDI